MDKLILKRAKPNHIEAIADIMRSNDAIYTSIMPGAMAKYADYMLVNGLSQHYKSVVVLRDNKVIGFLGMKPMSQDRVYLIAFYLHSHYQRIGIGKAVMDQFISICQQNHQKEIILLAHKDAAWALDFYEKNQFKCIATCEESILDYGHGCLKEDYLPNTHLYQRRLEPQ